MKDFEYTEADDKLEQRRQIKKTIKKIKRDNWSDDKIIEMLKSIHFNFIWTTKINYIKNTISLQNCYSKTIYWQYERILNE